MRKARLLQLCVSLTLLLAGNLVAGPPKHRFPREDYANALEKEMILAAYRGDLATVKDSLNKGSRIDARYGGESKDFAYADGGSPGTAPNWTALRAALEKDHLELARYLIDKGANVGIDDGWGGTPLFTLAEKRYERKEYSELTKMLIEKGADVNATTAIFIDGPGDETALHRAVAFGHVEMVKSLLKAGADVNAKTSRGQTPLDYLDRHENRGIRSVLIQSGAKTGDKLEPAK